MTKRSIPVATFRRAVRIGSALNVYLGTAADVASLTKKIEAEIKRALDRGETVTEGGVSQWIEESEVCDCTKRGSAAYTWRGDKVKVERTLVTKTGGVIQRSSLGFAWRKLD